MCPGAICTTSRVRREPAGQLEISIPPQVVRHDVRHGPVRRERCALVEAPERGCRLLALIEDVVNCRLTTH